MNAYKKIKTVENQNLFAGFIGGIIVLSIVRASCNLIGLKVASSYVNYQWIGEIILSMLIFFTIKGLLRLTSTDQLKVESWGKIIIPDAEKTDTKSKKTT